MTLFISLGRKTYRTLQLLQAQSMSTRKSLPRAPSFVPQKVLVLTKISRYEFEKLCHPTLDESLLRQRLLEHGSDYDAIIESHLKNKETEKRTIEVLEKLDIEYKIIDRLSIKAQIIEWADLILPIGGDGTFLLASSLITDNKKPIIGINSDPSSSQGHLLLPPSYTNDVLGIFDRLKSGRYKNVMRNRIRVTLKGDDVWSQPFHLHNKGIVTSDERFYIFDTESKDSPKERRLPWLALNEVFIGESHSARTSFLLMNTDTDDKFHKVMSSGLCVSTGTGSTSWYQTINALNTQEVRDVFVTAKCDAFFSEDQVDQITKDYNKSLEFASSDSRMSYAIRDLIGHKKFRLSTSMPSRGFCNKLTVRSLCFDAGLVLDAGIAVPFNAGTSAVMEIHESDALRNIALIDDI